MLEHMVGFLLEGTTMESKFNQQEYISNFNKEKYTQFNVRLSKEEKTELDVLLKKQIFQEQSLLKKY